MDLGHRVGGALTLARARADRDLWTQSGGWLGLTWLVFSARAQEWGAAWTLEPEWGMAWTLDLVDSTRALTFLLYGPDKM